MNKGIVFILLVALLVLIGVPLWEMVLDYGKIVGVTEECDKIETFRSIVLYDNMNINAREAGIMGTSCYIPENFPAIICIDENGFASIKNLELFDREVFYNSEESKIEHWVRTTTYKWLFFTRKEKETWYKFYIKEEKNELESGTE